jgi:hypothetical protein
MKAIKTYKGKTSKNAEVEITANFKDEFLRTNLVFTGWADTGSKKIEIKDGELRTLRDKDGNFLEGIKFSCSESPDGTASIKITEDMQDWIKEVKQGYGALQEEHFSHYHTFFVHGWESHEVTIDDRKLEDEIKQIAKYYEIDGITEEHVKEQFDKEIAKEKAREERKRIVKEKKQEEEKRINEKYQHIETEILERKTIKGGEGPDYIAIVKCKNKNTDEELKFHCRNIFDVGYVINPAYAVAEGVEPGGLRDGDYWNVYPTGKARKLTDFEKDCLDLLSEKPPVFKEVRL